MSHLLEHLNIFYEKIGRDLRISPSQSNFWRILDTKQPREPLPLEDVIPETIGLEKDITAIISSGCSKIRIPYIRRGDRYIHLNITPGKAGEYGIVAIEEISRDSVKQQVQVQKKNETAFLKELLEKKNEELKVANGKLDTLMKRIRTQNHHLETEIRMRTMALNNSRLTVITTLAQAAEFRDMETGGHIYRIGRSSVILGKKYGLSSTECESLFYSSLLHDLGKIGIPDSILLKPGPLSSREWQMMREHTTIGASLLSHNDHILFLSARDVALTHHEHWDGNGYPEGIAGENIPLIGRICAIVDVFDALISIRPYKKAFSTEMAVDIIKKASGSHFDPSVVKAFLDVLDDIISLQNDDSEELEMLTPDFMFK